MFLFFSDPKDSATGYSPEEPVLDPSVSIQTGYIESKWVAERLMQIGSEVYGLSTNVLRVGLLTGGSAGFWDPSQWFPAIAQSASYLGCLPQGNDVSKVYYMTSYISLICYRLSRGSRLTWQQVQSSTCGARRTTSSISFIPNQSNGRPS